MLGASPSLQGGSRMGVVVETSGGRVEGRQEDGLQVFRGIPYAAPPLGARRFAAPAPVEPWAGTRDAGAFANSAPQNPMMIPLPGMEVGETGEDCLYLNVWTPAADGARRPVLFFIHGGAFVIGSGSQPIYDGAALARRGDAVVVTINYRLGPLGFLFLPDLCPGLEGAVGNAGLRDQVAALCWVRENIERFGGDPGCITIFGESAGGMSVGTLLGAPAARGLFRRAIPQSGACQNVHTRETATRAAAAFLDVLGLSPAEAERGLREVPAHKLLESEQQTVLKLGTSLGLLAFQPAVDEDWLPEPPLEALRAGHAAGVDVLVGTTRDEWRLFAFLDPGIARLDEAGLEERLRAQVREAAPRVLAAYREARPDASAAELFFAIETDRIFRIPAVRLAEAQVPHHERVFFYRFDWESPALGGIGACHAVDLPFVFGGHERPGADFFIGTGPGIAPLAATTMDAWLGFARDGEPAAEAMPPWRPYALDTRATMILGPEPAALVHDPDGAERRAWDGLL
jgi:para-nitrobenzyl esterase